MLQDVVELGEGRRGEGGSVGSGPSTGSTSGAAGDRLAAAGDDAWPEGRAAAVACAGALREAGAAGIYLIPGFGRYDRAAEVIDAILAG